jgi:outer membrane receptor protein involved in Fe transport
VVYKVEIAFTGFWWPALFRWARSGSAPSIAAVATVLVLASGASAYAQQLNAANNVASSDSGADSLLQEVVVTATRREEPLSKVPISITAYSQDALDHLGVRSIDDLAKLTPGVTFAQANPGSGTNIQIRGISSLVGAATTGIYINDTPIQIRSIGYFPSNVYPEVFDLDRVEVLRGPQGTLFGAGSEGGTVRFITPEPSLNTFSSYSRAEVAGIDSGGVNYEGGAAVGGPIVDDVLGLRVSAWYRRDAGWIDRVDPLTGQEQDSDSNSQNHVAVRAALTLQPVGGLQITPGVYYQTTSFNNTNLYWANLSNTGDTRFRNGDPLGQPGSDRFTLSSIKVAYTASNVSVISDTSYFRRRSTIDLDYSTVVPDVVGGPAAPSFGIPGFTSRTNEYDGQDNFTQEIRFQPAERSGPFNWLVGLFYSHAIQSSFEGIGGENLDTLTEALFGAPNAEALFGPNYQPGDYALVSINHALDTQYAIYGNFDYVITDKFNATLGVRVARVESFFTNSQGGPFGGGPIATTGSSTAATPVTPKFSLSYQADDANLFYTSVAKGYRVGGGDAPVPLPECTADLATIGLTSTPETYKSDSLWSYEVGAKNRLGNRLRVESSAYFINWSNIQQQVFLPNCDFKYVANLGSLHSRGADLNIQYAPIEPLVLGAAIGFNDSKYTGNVYPGVVPGTGPNSVIVSKGDTIDTPPWTMTLTSHLTFPAFGAGNHVYVDSDFVYRIRNNGVLASSDPNSLSYDPQEPRMSMQHILGVRSGITIGNLDLSVFSTNVTNSTATTFTLHDSLTSALYKQVGIQPRVVGLTFVYRR